MEEASVEPRSQTVARAAGGGGGARQVIHVGVAAVGAADADDANEEGAVEALALQQCRRVGRRLLARRREPRRLLAPADALAVLKLQVPNVEEGGEQPHHLHRLLAAHNLRERVERRREARRLVGGAHVAAVAEEVEPRRVRQLQRVQGSFEAVCVADEGAERAERGEGGGGGGEVVQRVEVALGPASPPAATSNR